MRVKIIDTVNRKAREKSMKLRKTSHVHRSET